ncbi:MAG: PAS domain S-box protein [Oligoflexia bacterium]|nr:PAS domain S-box protein [Oligoflexia bacterium]
MDFFYLDIKTVIFLLFLGNLSLFILLAVYEQKQSLIYKYFVTGIFIQAIAWTLLLMRGKISDLFSAYIGNSILFLGLAFETLAFLKTSISKSIINESESNELENIKQKLVRLIYKNWFWEFFYSIITIVLIIVFWNFADTPSLKVGFASLGTIIIFVPLTVTMFRFSKKNSFYKFMGFFSSILCLVLSLRVCEAFFFNNNIFLMSSNLIQTLSFISLLCFMFIGAIGFLLILKENDFQQIQESEEKFRLLIDESTDPIFSFSSDGSYLYVNNAFASGVCRKTTDIIGKKIWDVFPKNEAEQRFKALKQVFETGIEKRIEVKVPRTNGDRYYITSIVPIFDSLKNVRTVICSSKDITERKLAEKALNESEEKYRNMFNNSIEGIYQATIDGKYRIVNPAFATMFGFESPDDVMISVKNIDEQVYVNPNDRERLIALMDKKKGMVKDFEVELKRKNGSIFWASINSVIIKNPHDNSRHIEGTIIDITARKQAIQEKEKLQVKLFHSSKLASIGTLAAGIAHEINNPLTIIKCNYQILNQEVDATIKKIKEDIIPNCSIEKGIQIDDDDINMIDIRGILKIQEQASDRIASIVNNLRIYSRPDTDFLESFNLNSTIMETIMFCEAIFKRSNIMFCTEFNFKRPIIEANAGKIQQVLMNIFSNSKDAIEEKANNNGLITIQTNQKGSNVEVRITDNGIGIDSSVFDKLFDPFYTTKSVGRGTGIGLSISQSLIDSFNGSIHIESTKNVGTTCVIELPLTVEYNKSSKNYITEKDFKKITGKVLIIEDEKDIRVILKKFLISFGLDVDESPDGMDGLNRIKQNKYDYIITDIKMPKLNGDQLILEMKKLNILETKILIITGGITSDFTENQHRIIEENVYGIISKPFSKENIYCALTKKI